MAGDIDIVIGAQDKASAVLDRVSMSITEMVAVGAGIGAGFAVINSAVSAVSGTIQSFANGVATSATRVDELADKATALGESVSVLEQFQFVMDRVGNISAETTIDALQKTQRLIGSIAIGENQAGADLFAKLQLDANALSLQGPVQQFDAIQQAIAGIENRSEQAAVAQQLFGKSASNILPALIASREEIDELNQRAELLKYHFTDAEVEGIGAMNDSLGEAQLVLTSLYDQLAAEISPAIQAAADLFVEWYTESQPFIDEAIPSLVDNMIILVGFATDFARVMGSVATLDLQGLNDVFKGPTTAWMLLLEAEGKKLDAQLAARDKQLERAAQRSAAAQAGSENESTVDAQRQIDKAQQEAERAKQESQRVIDRLQREKDVSVFGEDTIALWEDLAKATSEEERKQIEKLYEERAERLKFLDEQKEQERIEKQKEADEKRLQEKLAQPAPDNTAVESRLLTRGKSSDPAMQLLNVAQKNLAVNERIAKKLEEEPYSASEDSNKLELELVP